MVFRDLLSTRGEDPSRLTVRTLVPVSVRRPGEEGSYNNRVSAMFAELPVGIEDPVERLRAVSSQMEHLKGSHQAVAGDVLTSMSGFAPALLLALGMRVAFRMPQRSLNTAWDGGARGGGAGPRRRPGGCPARGGSRDGRESQPLTHDPLRVRRRSCLNAG